MWVPCCVQTYTRLVGSSNASTCTIRCMCACACRRYIHCWWSGDVFAQVVVIHASKKVVWLIVRQGCVCGNVYQHVHTVGSGYNHWCICPGSFKGVGKPVSNSMVYRWSTCNGKLKLYAGTHAGTQAGEWWNGDEAFAHIVVKHVMALVSRLAVLYVVYMQSTVASWGCRQLGEQMVATLLHIGIGTWYDVVLVHAHYCMC